MESEKVVRKFEKKKLKKEADKITWYGGGGKECKTGGNLAIREYYKDQGDYPTNMLGVSQKYKKKNGQVTTYAENMISNVRTWQSKDAIEQSELLSRKAQLKKDQEQLELKISTLKGNKKQTEYLEKQDELKDQLAEILEELDDIDQSLERLGFEEKPVESEIKTSDFLKSLSKFNFPNLDEMLKKSEVNTNHTRKHLQEYVIPKVQTEMMVVARACSKKLNSIKQKFAKKVGDGSTFTNESVKYDYSVNHEEAGKCTEFKLTIRIDFGEGHENIASLKVNFFSNRIELVDLQSYSNNYFAFGNN